MANATSDGTAAALETPSGKGARDENFPWVVAAAGAAAAARRGVLRLRPCRRRHRRQPRSLRRREDRASSASRRRSPARPRWRRPCPKPRRCARASPRPASPRATRRTCSPRSSATPLSCAIATGRTLSVIVRLSASPVGRYLLDLHGEASALPSLLRPLCDLLQLLNHLQDCRDDYRGLDRVYLLLDSFAAAGIGVEALDRPATSPALRQVLDRVLDGVDGCSASRSSCRAPCAAVASAAESAVILAIAARRLAQELRRRDPLAERVELEQACFFAVRAAGDRAGDQASAAPLGDRGAGAMNLISGEQRIQKRRRPGSSSASRTRTCAPWSSPPAPLFTGACAFCRRSSATRCTRSMPFAARSTTSPTAMRRSRRSSTSWRVGGARSMRCSKDVRAGRPRSRCSTRPRGSICPPASSTP